MLIFTIISEIDHFVNMSQKSIVTTLKTSSKKYAEISQQPLLKNAKSQFITPKLDNKFWGFIFFIFFLIFFFLFYNFHAFSITLDLFVSSV